MARGKKHSPEQIVNVLRQVEVAIANGKSTPLACKEAGIIEQRYYPWRREYGECDLHISGLSVSSAKGDDQVRAGLYELSARRQSCCLETDATDGAGVAAASPNVQTTGRTHRAM